MGAFLPTRLSDTHDSMERMIMMYSAVRMRTQASFNAHNASNWGVVSGRRGGKGGDVPLESLLYVVCH